MELSVRLFYICVKKRVKIVVLKRCVKKACVKKSVLKKLGLKKCVLKRGTLLKYIRNIDISYDKRLLMNSKVCYTW